MCECQLSEGLHWYVDNLHAPGLYEIARSPEQAERNLRAWAAKVVRLGHVYLDIRSAAAKILATRRLNLVQLCTNQDLLAELQSCCIID